MKKVIVGFVIFGAIAGLISVWFRQNSDMVFLLNLPGTLVGDVVYRLSIRLLGDPGSAQAHYTIPWLLRLPQVYVPSSMLVWGVSGTLLALLLRPKVIAWVMVVYALVLGGLHLAAGYGLL